MSDTTYPLRTATRRPRLQTTTGIRLDEPVDGYEGPAARAVLYCDGYSSTYLGAVYREGRGAWSAYAAQWTKTLDDARLRPDHAPADRPTFPSRDAAVAAIVAHAGIVL
jgi:hypothetical protein